MLKPKLTNQSLVARMPLLNSKELERRAGLKNGRLTDVKRGKSKLREDELEIIKSILEELSI